MRYGSFSKSAGGIGRSMEKEVAPRLVKRIAGMLLVVLVVSLVAMAQQPSAAPQSGSTTTSAPKNEFFAGYSWYDPRGYYTGNTPGVAFNAPSIWQGFGAAYTRNFGDVFGVTADYSGHFGDVNRVNTLMVGPQF